MTRVKGWVKLESLMPANMSECQCSYCSPVYVEEIPPTAVRCEAMVYSNRDSGWMQPIERLPAHLIGKKVSVIIIPEEEI